MLFERVCGYACCVDVEQIPAWTLTEGELSAALLR
ncbi:MAG: hypothetical protein JWQ81_2004, partial [Amycolatopsis sp.]|nr:hypothetical protein [Amycolatopsis sp.]